jgi:hypothetical protein
MPITQLSHLVLKVTSSQDTLNFYQELFGILGYTQDIKDSNFWNFSDDVIAVGLYFEDEFQEGGENTTGLGHIAWDVGGQDIIDKAALLIQRYNLEAETHGTIKAHHGIDFFTCCFYCPSGNRLELVYKP